MSQGLVVGIFPTSDSATIENALSAAQIDANKVKVIRLASAASPADESSELDFVERREQHGVE